MGIKVKAPKLRVPAAVEGAAGRSAGRAAAGEESAFVQALRAIFRRGGTAVGLRLGFSALEALADVSPDIAIAFSRLEAANGVARIWPAGRIGLIRSAAARAQLRRALEQVGEDELAEAVRRIRAVAGRTPVTSSGRALLAAALEDVESRFPDLAAKATARVGQQAAKIAGKATRFTAFDLVERAARVGEVAIAQQAFNRELSHGDAVTIRKAGEALADAIARNGRTAGLSARDIARTRGAIATVVRSFERQVPGATEKAARKAVVDAMAALAPDDGVVAMLRRVLPWMSEASWPEVAAALARVPPASKDITKRGGETLADAVRWRIWAIKGVLGDAIARAGKYRRVRAAELARARRFLEGPAGAGYTLLDARTPIRATVKDATRFALSYDDAVLLVDEQAKKVVVVMAAQFKAGDAGALKALAQTERDIIREADGQLLIDGKQYAIELGVLPTRRIFVGTKLGVDPDAARTFAQQLGRKELTFVDLPTDPADLDGIAAFLLRAVGAIPQGGG